MQSLETLWQDARYALRMMRRSPGFTAVAVVSLALGSGANTAVFSVVNALMLRELPVRNPSQLVEVLSTLPGDPRMNHFWWKFYEQYRDRNHVFSELIAMSPSRFRVGDGQDVELVPGEYVVGTFFQALGLQPSLGRLIGPEDDRLSTGDPAVAVISWSYVFGLAPVWNAFAVPPSPALRETGAVGETRSRRVFGRTLVVAQVALAVILLSTAGLFVNHLSTLRHHNLGFERDSVLLVTLDPTHSGYTRDRLSRSYQDLLARLEAIPGVRSAALSAITPIEGGAASRFVSVEAFHENPQARRRISLNWVGPKYFQTLGTAQLAGRDFTSDDETALPSPSSIRRSRSTTSATPVLLASDSGSRDRNRRTRSSAWWRTPNTRASTSERLERSISTLSRKRAAGSRNLRFEQPWLHRQSPARCGGRCVR